MHRTITNQKAKTVSRLSCSDNNSRKCFHIFGETASFFMLMLLNVVLVLVLCLPESTPHSYPRVSYM